MRYSLLQKYEGIQTSKDSIGEPRVLKTIFVTISIIFSIILLHQINVPTNGYEYNLYDILSIYHWIGIILLFTIGQVTIIIFGKRRLQGFAVGFVSIFFGYLSIYLVPITRGYYLYGRQDMATHIGHIEGILVNGHFEYARPVLHFLASITAAVTSIGVSGTTIGLAALFSIFCFITIFAILRNIFSSMAPAYVGASIIVPIISLNFAPYTLGVYYLPLVLFAYMLFIGHNTIRNGLLLISILAFSSLIHEMILLYMIGIFALHQLLYSYWNDKEYVNSRLTAGRPILLMLTSIFVYWYILLNNRIFQILHIISVHFGRIDRQAQAEQYVTIFGTFQGDYLELGSIIYFKYGREILLLTLAGLSFLYLLKSSQWEDNKYYAFSLFLIAIFGTMGFVTFFTYVIVGFERLIIISVLATVVPISGAFHRFYTEVSNNRRKRQVLSVAFVLIIILANISVVYSVFGSTYNKETHQQLTHSEYGGVDWFLSHNNPNFNLYMVGTDLFRVEHVLDGEAGRELSSNYRYTPLPPPKFNFGKDSQTHSYIFASNLGVEWYQRMYPSKPNKWRYTAAGYTRFRQSPESNTVYTTGNVRILLYDG